MLEWFRNLEPFQIMFYLFIITAFLNYYRLRLEDDERNPILQSSISVICFILAILSLPYTVAAILIAIPYTSRTNKEHEKVIASIKSKMITEHVLEVQTFKDRIAKYDALIESDRKRSYNDGYQAGSLEARKEFEIRVESRGNYEYRRGYLDGQKDHSIGINCIEDIENDK